MKTTLHLPMLGTLTLICGIQGRLVWIIIILTGNAEPVSDVRYNTLQPCLR